MKFSGRFAKNQWMSFGVVILFWWGQVYGQMPPGPPEGGPPMEEAGPQDTQAAPPDAGLPEYGVPIEVGPSAADAVEGGPAETPPPAQEAVPGPAVDIPESEIIIKEDADAMQVSNEVIKGLHSAAFEIEKKAQKDSDEVDAMVNPLHKKYRDFDKNADAFHNYVGEQIGSYAAILDQLKNYVVTISEEKKGDPVEESLLRVLEGKTEEELAAEKKKVTDDIAQLKVKVKDFEKQLNKVRAAVEVVAADEAMMLEEMRIADNRRSGSAASVVEIGQTRREILEANDEKKSRSLFEKVISTWGGVKKTKEYVKERTDSFAALVEKTQKRMSDIRADLKAMNIKAESLKEEVDAIGKREAAIARADEKKVTDVIREELDAEEKVTPETKDIKKKISKKEPLSWELVKKHLLKIWKKVVKLAKKVAKKVLLLASQGLDWLADQIDIGKKVITRSQQKKVDKAKEVQAPPVPEVSEPVEPEEEVVLEFAPPASPVEMETPELGLPAPPQEIPPMAPPGEGPPSSPALSPDFAPPVEMSPPELGPPAPPQEGPPAPAPGEGLAAAPPAGPPGEGMPEAPPE